MQLVCTRCFNSGFSSIAVCEWVSDTSSALVTLGRSGAYLQFPLGFFCNTAIKLYSLSF